MLINQNRVKSSDELLEELLGNKVDNLKFLLLSNDYTVQDKYRYDLNGNRTDEIEAKGVTLHIVGLGSEIDVKVTDPNFSLKSKGLKELVYVRPIDLKVYFFNNSYYWSASDIKVA